MSKINKSVPKEVKDFIESKFVNYVAKDLTLYVVTSSKSEGH